MQAIGREIMTFTITYAIVHNHCKYHAEPQKSGRNGTDNILGVEAIHSEVKAGVPTKWRIAKDRNRGDDKEPFVQHCSCENERQEYYTRNVSE